MLKKTVDLLNSNIFWLLIALTLFAGLGIRGPWPPDEPRFALIAKEMVEQGQWLFPMRGGELYADKPPLFMWAIAVFYSLTGDINVSFLLPSLFAAAGTLYCVFDLTKRLADEKTAQFACGLLVITPQFLIQAKFAQIDMWVTFWITLGIYGLVRSLYLQHGTRWFYVAFIAMGLGIISKGVGFLPLFFLLAVWGWRKYSFQSMTQFKQVDLSLMLQGIGGLLAVCCVWLVPMLLAVATSDDPQLVAYRDDILLRQTAGRYADPWHHFQPWYYYLTAVIPWFWLPLVVLVLGRWKQFLLVVKQPITKIFVTFSLLVLIFFTLSPAKRGVYILPALPPMVIVLALTYRAISLPKWVCQLQSTVVILVSALIACVGILLAVGHPKILSLLQEGQVDSSGLFQSGCLLVVVGMLLLLSLKVPSTAGARIFTCVTSATCILPLIMFPLLQPIRTPTLLMQNAYEIAAASSDSPQIAMIDFKEQHLLYSPHEITHFGYSASLVEQERRAWLWLANHKDRFVIASIDFNLECFDLSKAVTLGVAHRKTQVMLWAKDRKAHCAEPDRMQVYTASQNRERVQM